MITIDHQQAAIRAIAAALHGDACPADPDPGESCGCGDYEREAEIALTAAAPHLRAGMADELLDDTPGSPLTRGYQRLMDPKPGEHPVRTWEAAVRVMLDTLLEGGGE